MGFCKAATHTTPAEVEPKAIKSGLELVIQHGITWLEIESDAQTTLEHLLTGTLLYDNLIFECRYLLSKLETWVLWHVFREQNRTADYIAKEGASLGNFGNMKVFIDPPNFVLNHSHADSMGTPYLRRLANSNIHSGRDVAYG